jgi:hypothetical protein
MSLSFGPYLLDEVSSGAVMCSAALNLAFCAEVSFSVATCPPALGSDFLKGKLQCCQCPTALGGLWTTGIKKCLAALPHS